MSATPSPRSDAMHAVMPVQMEAHHHALHDVVHTAWPCRAGMFLWEAHLRRSFSRGGVNMTRRLRAGAVQEPYSEDETWGAPAS